MIPNLPVYIFIVFVLTTIATLLLFNWTIRSSATFTPKKGIAILILLVVWLLIQGALALNNVYNANLAAVPPRFLILGILPPMILIIVLLISKTGRAFMDSLPLQQLTILSIVRIPVEIGLFRLYLNGAVPRLMTFEGGNLDIISGISAAIIAWYAFRKQTVNRTLLLVWNFLCLGLLANIVIRAILSAPFPFQKLAFDQPNIAIINFPFVWLPTFIVPLVLFSHVTSIRQLLRTDHLL